MEKEVKINGVTEGDLRRELAELMGGHQLVEWRDFTAPQMAADYDISRSQAYYMLTLLEKDGLLTSCMGQVGRSSTRIFTIVEGHTIQDIIEHIKKRGER